MNSCTDDINKLEIELEVRTTDTSESCRCHNESITDPLFRHFLSQEANATFRILLNESTRRLKLSAKKLGSSIEKSRPYHEATEKARVAQIECQKAAAKFQRANGKSDCITHAFGELTSGISVSEIHAAAKETVALAEERFMSNSHEWQFDNAWQEMLNHATLKVSLHFCHVSPNVTAFRGRNTHFGAEQSLRECVSKFPFANDDIAMLPSLA